MADIAAEVETKLDVPAGFEVPDLSGFGGTVERDVVQLVSTYHDTPERDLFRFHLALRRRDGDADTGWHLKVPGHGFRTEIRLPPSDALPAELADLLRPFLRGAAVVPAVRLETRRVRHRILDGGVLVAEVALDDVHAVALGTAVRTEHWTEAEVELGAAGSVKNLEKLVRTLTKAGAEPSVSRSKLARALLGTGNEGLLPTGAQRSAGAVLLGYLAAQADAIVAGHFAIHQDADDSVHQTRVACRRLRSTLRTFAGCFDADQADGFEQELGWWAGVLGELRDREVVRARLLGAVGALPSRLVVGPVAERIDTALTAEIASARDGVLAEMDGDRYAELLAEVRRWRDDPPFTTAAGRPANTLHDDLAKAEKQLAKRLTRATGRDGTDEQMHSARKAGKRLRYAREAARSGSSRKVRGLQEMLGDYQDGIVAMETLTRLVSVAREHGEDAFTYGVLLAKERELADQARERLATQRRS